MAAFVYNHYCKEDKFQGKFSHCQYVTIIKVPAGKSLVIRVSNDAVVKKRHFQGSCALCEFVPGDFVFVRICFIGFTVFFMVLSRSIEIVAFAIIRFFNHLRCFHFFK